MYNASHMASKNIHTIYVDNVAILAALKYFERVIPLKCINTFSMPENMLIKNNVFILSYLKLLFLCDSSS